MSSGTGLVPPRRGARGRPLQGRAHDPLGHRQPRGDRAGRHADRLRHLLAGQARVVGQDDHHAKFGAQRGQCDVRELLVLDALQALRARVAAEEQARRQQPGQALAAQPAHRRVHRDAIEPGADLLLAAPVRGARAPGTLERLLGQVLSGSVVEHHAGDGPEHADPILLVQRLDVEASLVLHFARPNATTLPSGSAGPWRVLWGKRGTATSAMTMERRTPLGVLLAAAERALAAELESGLREAGYADLRSAHAQVFLALDADGSRLTDLAGRAGMTKQAMGELGRYLEQHGYLEADGKSTRLK